MRKDPRQRALVAVLNETLNDDIAGTWFRAITSWAQSQRSRRIALRCRAHELRATEILCAQLGEENEE